MSNRLLQTTSHQLLLVSRRLQAYVRILRRNERLKQLELMGRGKYQELEQAAHRANQVAIGLIEESSRWTPSAVGLKGPKGGQPQEDETKYRLPSHHPISQSSLHLKRPVNDEKFEDIRKKLIWSRHWKKQQPIVAYPKKTQSKNLPLNSAGDSLSSKSGATNIANSSGFIDKSTSLITSALATATTRLPLPTLSIPELPTFRLGHKPSAKQAKNKQLITEDISIRDKTESGSQPHLGFFRPTSVTEAERKVEGELARLISDLYVRGSSDHMFIKRVERICTLIHEHPWVRGEAIKHRLLEKLLELRWRNNGHQETILQVEEALALLGYHDPPPGCGIKILTIDGGGMRGIVALEMLKTIERTTGKPIHQLFDLICGVSTGAIIASLLGFHRFPLDKVENIYNSVGTNVFSQNFLEGARGFLASHSYYNAKLFEKVLQDFVGTTRTIDTKRVSRKGPNVAIVSTLVSDDRIAPFIFRNYVHPHFNISSFKGSFRHPVWEAVRASTAAPGYFDDFYLDGMIHQDGGILANNPTQIAIHEAQKIWPGHKLQCVMSLGLGRPAFSFQPSTVGEKKRALSITEKFSRIVDSATDTELVHESMLDLIPPHIYYRFNPYLDEFLPLDEIRPEKFHQMKEATNMYLRRNDRKVLRACNQLTKSKHPWDTATETGRELYQIAKSAFIFQTPKV